MKVWLHIYTTVTLENKPLSLENQMSCQIADSVLKKFKILVYKPCVTVKDTLKGTYCCFLKLVASWTGDYSNACRWLNHVQCCVDM